jgi:hypothetical protein
MRSIVAIVVLLTLAFCGVAGCTDATTEVLDELRCVWSAKHHACFCTAHLPGRAYLTWTPPELCGSRSGKGEPAP